MGRLRCRATVERVTVALPIAAPELSVTLPEIVALAICACSELANIQQPERRSVGRVLAEDHTVVLNTAPKENSTPPATTSSLGILPAVDKLNARLQYLGIAIDHNYSSFPTVDKDRFSIGSEEMRNSRNCARAACYVTRNLATTA